MGDKTTFSGDRAMPNQTSYYTLLGLHPSASALEIRRAYRALSKRYHPDTTTELTGARSLPPSSSNCTKLTPLLATQSGG